MKQEFEFSETFQAYYEIEQKMIRVHVKDKGEKWTQLGNSTPESLARILAGQIVREAKLNWNFEGLKEQEEKE